MHAERDYLVKRVFPELAEWCEKRRLHLVDIDLRWGITQEDSEKNKRVVEVCLSNIDKCRPFFLCFMGQRRGWIPSKSDISDNTFKEFPKLSSYMGSSVTEMEIIHALIDPMLNGSIEAVSYTHLDVYKRQPYNMEKDLDRLSFESAIGRFLSSGSREDAFDIYYCYCEIFKPFGSGYDSTGLLLEMLSEHEANASSLLMKHRDHYSHSVYVFLIGLAIYKNIFAVRYAYNKKYGLKDGKEAACHFLEYWGLASLFHDIGYPFEIAHQQMKAYVCKLDKSNNLSLIHI